MNQYGMVTFGKLEYAVCRHAENCRVGFYRVVYLADFNWHLLGVDAVVDDFGNLVKVS
jgi:hypothetical protein